MGPAQRNIETVVKMEEEFLQKRTFADRVSDAIVDAAGSMKVFLGHIAVFAFWMLLNSGKLRGVKPWDPFPFILLTLTVSMEGVLVALFVLMKQNRMSRRADERDHLHLQVALLAEKEITKVLQLQQRLCEHLGIEDGIRDDEVRQLSEETAVESLARELREKLPEE